MAKQIVSYSCLCLILFCLVLIPSAGAIVEYLEVPASSDPLAQDSPENIAALKAHNAYTGGSQDARMGGVIAYIESIGGNAGTGELRQVQTDYMAAVAAIPSMKTADQINGLRDEMRIHSIHFAEVTQSRLLLFNGTHGDMQKSITISVNAFDTSLANLTGPFWLSEPSARITLFDRESDERNFTMRNLIEEGFDVTRAQQISERIDAIRPELEAAVQGKQAKTILETHTKIKSLTQQYRNTVAALRAGTEVSG